MGEGSNHNDIMYMLGGIKNQLSNIEIQTTKTNGRINKLEGTVEEHGRFIDSVKTKVALVSTGVSLVGFLAWEWVKNKFFTT